MIRTYGNTYLSYGAESLLSDNNKGTTSHPTAVQLDASEKHLTANVYTDPKALYFGSEIILGSAILAQVSMRCLVD